MKRRQLKTVTLLGIDCIDIDRLILAANICEEYFEFANVKLLSSIAKLGDKRIVPISPITSIEEYSHFIITQLDVYVNTPHVLIFQYDGFILNPSAWTDEFLKYDYIGAPWLVGDWSVEKFNFPKELLGQLIVGNGGFSLRSKKFTSVCAELSREKVFKTYHPEDVVLCVWDRKLLEEHNIQFAPVSLARCFSFENETEENDAWNGQFGFHGLLWTDISKWLDAHPKYKHLIVNDTTEYKINNSTNTKAG